MNSPYNDQELKTQFIDAAIEEYPVVSPEGAIVETDENLLEDVKSWIDEQDPSTYRNPGGIDQFDADLNEFIGGFSRAGELH